MAILNSSIKSFKFSWLAAFAFTWLLPAAAVSQTFQLGEDLKFRTRPIDARSVSGFIRNDAHSPELPPWQPANLPDLKIPFNFSFETSTASQLESSAPVVSSDGKLAAVGLYDVAARHGQFVIFDLEQQTVVSMETFEGAELIRPLAISPDNQTLVATLVADTGVLIGFWQIGIDGEETKYKKGWLSPQYVKSGHYINEEFLLLNGAYDVVVFDVEKDKAVKRNPSKALGPPYAGGSGYGFDSRNLEAINLRTGERIRYPFSSIGKYDLNSAISANGRLVAGVVDGQIKVHDMVTKQLVSEISALSVPRSPAFLTNRYLIAGEHLYDLKLKAAVARVEIVGRVRIPEPFVYDIGSDLYLTEIASSPLHYQLPGGQRLTEKIRKRMALLSKSTEAISQDGSILLVQKQDKTFYLSISRILTPELGDKVGTLTAGERLELDVHTPVELKTSNLPPNFERDLRSEISQKLLSRKDSGRLLIEASVEPLPAETIKVDHSDAGEAEVTFTPTESTFRISVDGFTVFEKQTVNRPGATLKGQPGETPQIVADRMCQPNKEFFVFNTIPNKGVIYAGELPKITISADGTVVE